MKQTIQTRFGQQLNMTPQLQQAIRILQLSSLELQHEVQEALESNPMLEAEEEAVSHDTPEQPNSDADISVDGESKYDSNSDYESGLNLEHVDLTSEWPVDSDWTDIYDSYALSTGGSNYEQKNEYEGDPLAQNCRPETLRDYLTWQLNLAKFSDQDLAIATAIVDTINDDGYVTSTLEDILAGIQDLAPTLADIVSVLHRLQAFDPAGVAARDLRECLLIQLRQIPEDTPVRQNALTICESCFDLLGNQCYATLKDVTLMSDEELKAVMQLLRTLQPYPGAKVVESKPQYIIPDVFVSRRSGTWHVELNQDIAPRLRINVGYAKLIRRADTSADNVYLKNHLQEARWFLKNLASRNETLLRVAVKIVELQRDFFDYGPEAMRPLVLRDVAEALVMHESTVSRVTSQKYLYSPRGTVEFKFFFPSHVSTNNGGQCSAVAIRSLIKKLIAMERPEMPLSDDTLAKILAEQGIKVARRTITKYRESMGIQPSTMRKRLLW